MPLRTEEKIIIVDNKTNKDNNNEIMNKNNKEIKKEVS